MCSANSYPTQLQQLLGADYDVRNYGVSGFCMLTNSDCPYVRLPQWHDALNFNPDIVVLKMGTNDTKPWNWQHADEFESDYQHFIDTLKALPSKPKIILAYPIRVFDNPFSIRDSVLTASIIPTIKELARKNHLQTLDLHSVFTPELLQQSKSPLIQSDGVHPTKEGAAIIARKVMEEIIKLGVRR
jgi:lysophospholipase L1-like esterase